MHKSRILILVLGSFGCEGYEPADDPAQIEMVQQPLTNCMPGPDEVAVFTRPAFFGSCVNLPLTDESFGNWARIPDAGFPNDDMESVRLGSNVWATVFDHTFQRGGYRIITSDFDRLEDLNNRISSVRIQKRDRLCRAANYQPAEGQIALYQDANFGSDCVVYSKTDTFGGSRPPGEVHSPVQGMYEDNTYSSLKVGPNTTVQLFRDHWLSGTSEFMTQNVASFVNTIIGNDTVSSFRVF